MSEGVRASLQWAAHVWGRSIRDVQVLRGGWTSSMLRLEASDGERAVLRLLTEVPWRRHAPALLTRESDIQRQLSGTDIPAPNTIAVDAHEAGSRPPVHLMSWLPGSLELVRFDDALLDGAARTLRAVHRHRPQVGARPRTYESWAGPAKRFVPDWTDTPDIWLEAFAVLERDPPAYRGTFLHRDFHLGNLLWMGDRVTGLVDWVETSWGPAWLDVAHMRTYLAMLHGPDAAVRFADVYQALAGLDEAHTERECYWDVLDIVGYLPDPRKVVQPWRDLGLDVSDSEAQARLERHLNAVLGA